MRQASFFIVLSALCATASFAQPKLVINELMFAPKAPEPEWVELYNPSESAIDIRGWSLVDASDNSMVFSDTLSPIPPKSYVLVTRKDTALRQARSIPPSVTIIVGKLPGLNNDEETLTLRDSSGSLIDIVSYSGMTVTGRSLERVDPFTSQSAFRLSVDSSGCTPGLANSVLRKTRDLSLRDLRVLRDSEDFAIAAWVFNEGYDTATSVLIELRESSYTLPVASLNEQVVIAPQDSLKITLTWPAAHYGKQHFTASLGLDDDLSNDTTSLLRDRPIPFDSLLLSEIMYDPLTGGSQWIEVYNPMGVAIQLDSLELLTSAGLVQHKRRWPSYVLAAKSSAVLAANREFFQSYPELANTQGILTLESNDLGMGVTGGSVLLRNVDASAIDSLRYSDSWHNPLLANHEGRSLERQHFDHPNDSTNWQSSADERGATPMAAAHASSSTATASTALLQVAPNPFSPDGDGYEDAATITITLPKGEDRLVRIRAFDAAGNIVRKLAEDKFISASTEIPFDGRTDRGQTLGIGIYTLLVETYDTSHTLRETKRVGIVIAGKRK